MAHPSLKLRELTAALLTKLKTDLPALITAAGLPDITLWTVAHPILLLQSPAWSGKYLPIIGVDYNYPNGSWRSRHMSISGERFEYKCSAFVLTELVPTQDVAGGIIGHPSMATCEDYMTLVNDVLDSYHDDPAVPFYRMHAEEGGVMHMVNSGGLAIATMGFTTITAVSGVG